MALNLLDDTNRITVTDSELDDVQGGDPDTTYTVRQIPPSVNAEISRKHTKRKPNKRNGQMDTEIDQMALVDDLLDYALLAWSGIQHQGQPVPCERQFKTLLDYPRKAALISVAGLNQRAQEVRDESFRAAPIVL